MAIKKVYWNEEIKAGYLYAVGLKNTLSLQYDLQYVVCLGKRVLERDSFYLFALWENSIINEKSRGVESFRHMRGKVNIVYISCVGISYLECYGKVVSPTEIKAWLVSLKLSGLCIFNMEELNKPFLYVGDWTKREKLPCVKRFRKGGLYVEEGLAYIRTKSKYESRDEIYRYMGKDNDCFCWDILVVGDIWAYDMIAVFDRNRKRLKNQLRNMVEYREQNGYQVQG
jgi:hypothetical protein